MLTALVTLAATASVAVAGLATQAHTDADGRVQLDVHFDCALAPPLAALRAAGFSGTSTVKSGALCVVEGWAAPTAIAQLSAVAGVSRIAVPTYVLAPQPRTLQPVMRTQARQPVRKQGATGINQNGITIMRADQFVAHTHVTGAGITVGVQSVGVYSLSTIQARGELPGSITVLYPAGNTAPAAADEGTVLLEQIHSVAPDANLMFCGPFTFVDYVSCLSQLISGGANIVLDDTGFVSDSVMAQDNDQTSAVSQILAQNPSTLMLSSSGNNDGSYWEGNYTPVSAATTSLPPLSCPTGAGAPDAYVATFGSSSTSSQQLNVTGYANIPLLFAWADSPTQITSQFDVYWFAAGSTSPLGCLSTTGATSNQLMQILTVAPGSYSVIVASQDATASGRFLKLWAGGDGLTTFSTATSGGLISPQAMATGVINVGAVNGSDGIGNTIESFSSTGPLRVAFPAPAQLQAPTLVAPDGVSVDAAGTYFAADLFPDGNFYGTSAAVPNAGAVAALLRSAFPALSVSQITTALQSGATVLGASTPDSTFGYGRVDALGALGTLATPTITALSDGSSSDSATSAAQSFTVTGTGPVHFSVSSSNSALVPASIVSAGNPGVTVSAGCGTSTLTCTLAVTPALGQSGTTMLTFSALDGANRAATAQMNFTETDPAPAPPGGTSGSGGTGSTGGTGGSGSTGGTGSTTTTTSAGGGGGGALQSWVLLCLGLALIQSRRCERRRRRA